MRKQGDGTLPVPGWNSEYDWTGYIPFDELPYTFNPESGFIATANNQSNPREYPYNITKDWDHGQRAARIVDMIENAPGKIDAAYIQSMHGDSKSLNAEVLMPLLLAVKLDPAIAAVRDNLSPPGTIRRRLIQNLRRCSNGSGGILSWTHSRMIYRKITGPAAADVGMK